MCWNEQVSLNTFVFSNFVLGLLIYNNTYTQYKIKELNNIGIYLLYFLTCLMQLIEFFIWRNIKNIYYNKFFTKMALFLLFIQPIASLMILSNHKLRNVLLFIYIVLLLIVYIVKYRNFNNMSTISPLGHLKWNLNYNLEWDYLIFFGWLLFLFFSLLYEGKWLYFLFGSVALMIITYKLFADKTASSVWCWFVNSIAIFVSAYLLFYLPFFENKKIC